MRLFGSPQNNPKRGSGNLCKTGYSAGIAQKTYAARRAEMTASTIFLYNLDRLPHFDNPY
jgi:hypothetical protein